MKEVKIRYRKSKRRENERRKRMETVCEEKERRLDAEREWRLGLLKRQDCTNKLNRVDQICGERKREWRYSMGRKRGLRAESQSDDCVFLIISFLFPAQFFRCLFPYTVSDLSTCSVSAFVLHTQFPFS